MFPRQNTRLPHHAAIAPADPTPRRSKRFVGVVAGMLVLTGVVTACGADAAEVPIINSGSGDIAPAQASE